LYSDQYSSHIRTVGNFCVLTSVFYYKKNEKKPRYDDLASLPSSKFYHVEKFFLSERFLKNTKFRAEKEFRDKTEIITSAVGKRSTPLLKNNYHIN